jgi:chemotaxis signal transduction protein
MDIDLDLDAAPPAAAAATSPAGDRVHAIDCGGLGIAVPFGWARSVVEEFELSLVPRAPSWMAGAANVEGRVVAVVDLGAWALPAGSAMSLLRSHLLLGGDGDDTFALRFDGLPVLARTDPGAERIARVPPELAPYVTGEASLDGGLRRWPVVDMAALGRAWAAELGS